MWKWEKGENIMKCVDDVCDDPRLAKTKVEKRKYVREGKSRNSR